MMDQPMCDKCHLPMVAVRGKVVRGMPVVTVKCVGCGSKIDIGPKQFGRREDAEGRKGIS
jgi:RNase P subunit RPR2